MIRFLAFCLALAPQAAWALSCLPWGVTNAYVSAAEAEEPYVPVLGELVFDPTELPRVDLNHEEDVPPLTRIKARFQGDAIGRRSDFDFAADVILEIVCFGPWRSRPQPGEMLGFLRKDGPDHVMATNPCGGFWFGAPRAENFKQMRDCVTGRRCVPQGLR